MSDLFSDLSAALGGTYRLERELGGGGMSRVILAEETALGRKVVIKVLPPDMAVSVNQDRFRREMQVVARLQRDVRVLRVGRTYVAAISYSHADPAVAQKVAQAFADAFKQKMAQENDIANSRLRASLSSEIDRATGIEKEALQARLRDIMVSRALPGMDVIILNNARLPGAPMAPRISFLVAVGLILGAVIGCALDSWMIIPGWIRGKTTPESSGVTLANYANHIDHICQLAGNANHVGLGSDLDGCFGTEQTPQDLQTIADVAKVASILKERGYTEQEIEGFESGNFLRFLKNAWAPVR